MGAPTPDLIVEPFGLNAGGSYIQLPIPVPTQLPGNPGNASFNDGFPPDTMTPVGSGGIPPRGQDMNGILYMITAYLQALTGGQFWPYNATWEAANSGYAVGAVVAMANGSGFWINTVASNANNPDTTAAATSGWVPLSAYGAVTVSGLTGGTTTLTAVQAAAERIYLTGTLTSNLQLILPPWLRQWRIINNTTGAFTVTAKTSGGNGIVCPPFAFGSTAVWGDGTNINLSECYGTGSFTGVLTGFASSINVTVQYTVHNNWCTLYSSAGNLATSTQNFLLMSGVPLACSPANGQYPYCNMVDNGVAVAGNTFIAGGGTQLNFSPFQTQASGALSTIVYGNANNFVTSGIKGIPVNWTVNYPLN